MDARSRFPRADLRVGVFGPHAFSIARRWLIFAGALAVGGAAALWELSPWRDSDRFRGFLFAVAIVGITGLVCDWAIRHILARRGEYRVVASADLLRGAYLDQIVSMGRAVMGDGHADVETLRRRSEVCPAGIAVLVRRTRRFLVHETVVGYFVCWTISEPAMTEFLRGNYKSGLDLKAEDLSADSPAAAYVTMIFGSDYAARLRILGEAASRLEAVFANGHGPQRLLARPATREGERLMRKFGMLPLNVSGSLVWSVDRERLRQTLASSTI